MSTAEILQNDRGAELIRNLFDSERWIVEQPEPVKLEKTAPTLTSKELKMTAANFEKGVSKVMSHNLDPISLPVGTYLELDNYRTGTLMLLDLETKRKGVVPASGTKIDYDLDYAGQIGYLMNCSSQDLIKLPAQRASLDSYTPTRFNVSPGIDGWQYSRLAWFAMVIKDKNTGINNLISFNSASTTGITKNLFQSTFGIRSELLRPALVGGSSRTTVKDYLENDVEQYQRLNSVDIYQEPANWLAKDVYNAEYSSRRLGRRAVRNLSSACLVGNSK